MSDATPQVVESCPSCGQSIDVTEQAPFSEVACPACGATMRARIQFNHFTLLDLLGEGGMGAVFKALDTTLQRHVALKILKPDAASTELDHEKLAAEARLTAAVNHPNVVKVFSFGEDHGQFYLAMELVEKGSLDGLMVMQNRLAEVQVLDVGIQAAEGLRAAYEVGLIHRDIKPGNILFAGPKLAKVVDFGLARVMDEEAQEAGEIWGTPFYVAPEKLDGRPEDFRSDIYSLGGTLFHALAGRPPFDAKTASMVVLKHIKSQAVSLQAFAPGISDETAYVINRMLHKDPEQRYQSYDELITHLQYARQQLHKRNSGPKAAARARARERARGLSERARYTAVWAPAAVLAVVAAAWFFLLGAGGGADKPAAPPPDAASAQGRQALVAGRFDEARQRFQAAVDAAQTRQPARNWALAQRGLAETLAGDQAAATATFAALERDGVFSAALGEQALGRGFRDLAAKKPSAPGDALPFTAFTLGLRDWLAGNVEAGGEWLERFERLPPQPPDGWTAQLRPLAAPYLEDYRAFTALQADARRATKAEAARLLVRIDQTKAAVKTGDPMRRRLDALAGELPLE